MSGWRAAIDKVGLRYLLRVWRSGLGLASWRETGSKDFFFVNKKEAKKLCYVRPCWWNGPWPSLAKVFCFFFSKKHAPGPNRGSAYFFAPNRSGCSAAISYICFTTGAARHAGTANLGFLNEHQLQSSQSDDKNKDNPPWPLKNLKTYRTCF
jgi:hypothetical protein